MTIRMLIALFALLAGAMTCNAVALGAPAVTVVLGPHADELEKFAASELAHQFQRLFNTEVEVATELPQKTTPCVLLGSPETNPAIADVRAPWPSVTDQTIVLQSFQHEGQSGLIVGGGSPAATLWAVYEFGYRHGVRYLLRDDVFPESTLPLKLAGFSVVMTPTLRTRAWQVIGDSPVGSECWPLADQKKLLAQLAKLRFNRIVLSIAPWHPFVHYECCGVAKQTAVLCRGQSIPVDRSGPGRTALLGATRLTNPAFDNASSYTQTTAAGIAYLRGIIDEARRLGMTVSLSISPLEFPTEFASLFADSPPAPGQGGHLIGPTSQSVDDTKLQELVAAKIRAFVMTYPEIDTLDLRLPQSSDWAASLSDAWSRLSGDANAQPTLDELLNVARDRTLSSSGTLGSQSLRSSVLGLAFLRKLLQHAELLTRADGSMVELEFGSIDPELFSIIDRLLPTGTSTQLAVDRTPRRILDHRAYLGRVPTMKLPTRLELPLADPQVGVLSQSTTGRLEALVAELKQMKWNGFVTRCDMLTELDPSVHYLSRTAWDDDVTARQAHNELFTAMTGKSSVADRLWIAWQQIEQATELIDQHQPGFASLDPNMMLQHYRAEPIPAWWDQLNEHYLQAMTEFYRANDAADNRSRRWLFYWAKRSEYVVGYVASVRALREAALAKSQGDTEQAIEQLEVAVEQLYNAIDHLSDVVRDPGDRALIAVLNVYAYQPLVAEYEATVDDE